MEPPAQVRRAPLPPAGARTATPNDSNNNNSASSPAAPSSPPPSRTTRQGFAAVPQSPGLGLAPVLKSPRAGHATDLRQFGFSEEFAHALRGVVKVFTTTARCVSSQPAAATQPPQTR